MQKKNGFSLIESLVVLSIFSIVVTMTLGTFRESGNSAILKDATATVLHAFEQARDSAASGSGIGNHGVHVKEKSIVIFEGTSYLESSGKEMPLHPLISTDQASTTIIFNRLSADTNASATIILTHDNGATSSIVITNDGTIYSQ